MLDSIVIVSPSQARMSGPRFTCGPCVLSVSINVSDEVSHTPVMVRLIVSPCMVSKDGNVDPSCHKYVTSGISGVRMKVSPGQMF